MDCPPYRAVPDPAMADALEGLARTFAGCHMVLASFPIEDENNAGAVQRHLNAIGTLRGLARRFRGE
jgi:hypothetical protein